MKRTISLIALLVTLLLVSCGKLNFSNKVIVEFDTKGGSEIGSKILNKDASLNEPNPPTKEGYSFLGWYSDSDYDNEIESFPLTIERDLILYAKWEINTYSLTFLVDEEVYFYQEHQFNEEVLIPLEPHQEGYTFGGWDLEIPFLMPGNDLVITGNLIKNSSALIFHYSENENETVSYQYPEETSAPTEPEKTGYRFLGWYLESELETAFIFGNPLLKDYDLYPKWVKEYQISFVENGGTKVNTLILTEEDDREFTNFRKRG